MSLSQHVVVGVIGDGENVRRHFRLSLALVATDDVVVIDGKPFVGVDSDTEETRVGVDQESSVSLVQVIDDGSFGKVSHVGQIFKKLVFGRVLLLNL